MTDHITHSIAIPVHNSQASIAELCERIIKTLSQFSFEIILVDDYSSDKSWEIIVQLKNEYPEIIKAIQFQKNYGQLAASLCAFSFCKGDFTITIDDDLQYDPADILLLIEKQRESNADIVYGIPAKKKQSPIRRLGGKSIQFVSNIFDGGKKMASSFRLINKETVQAITDNHKNSFISIDNIFIWYTSSFAFTEVSHYSRSSGHSGYNIIMLIKLYFTMATNYSIAPLKIMTQTGFIFSIIFFLTGVWYICKKLIHSAPQGYTSIIVTILFCSSIIIFCLGVIGQHLFVSFLARHNKPSYIIKKII